MSSCLPTLNSLQKYTHAFTMETFSHRVANASHHRQNKAAERSGAALFCPRECVCSAWLFYHLVREVHASLIVAFADFPCPFFTTFNMFFFSFFSAFIFFSLFV